MKSSEADGLSLLTRAGRLAPGCSKMLCRHIQCGLAGIGARDINLCNLTWGTGNKAWSTCINHFFCNLPPLLQLACTDTYRNEIAVYTISVTFIMVPFLLILVSYIRILHAILSIPSAAGRSKTFSTCSSHLIMVTLFFGSGIVTYLKPKSSYSLGSDKLLSLFYSVVSPMLNPLIYSLRNKEVKEALRRVMVRKIFI
ncbi:unnamed protein product [Caretta caretta]